MDVGSDSGNRSSLVRTNILRELNSFCADRHNLIADCFKDRLTVECQPYVLSDTIVSYRRLRRQFLQSRGQTLRQQDPPLSADSQSALRFSLSISIDLGRTESSPKLLRPFARIKETSRANSQTQQPEITASAANQ